MTTHTMTLTDFLLARIAEDEDRARRLQNAYDLDLLRVSAALINAGALLNPRHVLAECEAKRRIVEAESGSWTTRDDTNEVVESVTRWGPGGPDVVDVKFRYGGGERLTGTEFRDRYMVPSPPSTVLRLLALPYAAHPDFRDEWRP